jgi:hypothetical protein
VYKLPENTIAYDRIGTSKMVFERAAVPPGVFFAWGQNLWS